MANDGTIAFDSRINTDNLNRDLSEMEEAISDTATAAEKETEQSFSSIKSQVAKLAATYKEAGMTASDAMKKAWAEVKESSTSFQTAERTVSNFADKVEAELQNVGEIATQSFDGIPQNVEKSLEAANTSVDQFSGKLQNALAAAGLAYGAKEIIDVGTDYTRAMGKIAAAAGATAEEMDAMSNSIKNVYNSGIGENLTEVADVAAMVKQQFGDIDDKSLEQITQDAITMSSVFDSDLNETLRGVNALMSNMGLTAEEAFDYIAKGTQNGLDKSGELSDNLAEYSQIWEQAGFSAEEMFSILQNGLDSGAYNLDKVNDFVKEFTISLSDGRIEENLDSFSLGTQNIFNEWKNGNATQKDVFQSVISDLSNMTNEQEALTLASNTWSALGEDNAMKVITSLNNVNDVYSNVEGTMKSVNDVNYDNLATRMTALKRQFETEIVVPVAQKYMPKIEKAIDYVSEHLDEIVEHAKPIATAIAAAFAVKKITDFGSSVVTTAKTIKTAFKALNTSNPLGWIAIGVSALVGLETALRSMSSKHQAYLQGITDKAAEIPTELQKSIDATNEFADSWDNIKKNMDSNFTTESFDYESVVKLKDSLGELINADGTIKAGAEQKVSDIIGQLNQYADTGLTVSDGVIQKNGEVVASYDQISDSIDKVIEKQHAQNLLSVAEQGYQEALGSQQQLLDNETEYAKSLEETSRQAENVQKEIDSLYKTHALGTDINGNIDVDAEAGNRIAELKAELDGYNQKIAETTEARAKNNSELETSLAYISRYKGMQEDLLNGDFDKVGEEFAKLSSDFVTASTGTREELKQQVSDFQSQYETLLETQKKSPELVSDEQLQNALYLWNQAIVEAEASTGEHATKIGTNFVDTIAAAGMSHDDQITALNTYIQNRLNDGESLKKIADSLGVNFTSDMAAGAEKGGSALEEAEKSIINSAMANVQNDMYSTCSDTGYYLGLGIADGIDAAAIAIATSAINGVTAAIDAAKAAGAIYSPSHIMRDEVGYMLGLGTAAGLQKSTPAVQDASKNSVTAAVNAATDVLPNVGVTAEIAQALVPQTLGIMSNQGSSAVSAYNPAYQQIQTADMQHQPTPTQSNQGIRDIVIPVSIGEESIETIVVNAVTRANASSGGWSV